MSQDQLAALSYKVAQLENRLASTMLSQPDEIGHLRDDIKRLQQRTARSSELYESGNPVYGGPIRTYNSISVYTSGPFREDIDTSFPVDFDLWVPDNLLRIIRCQARFKPVKIRNSALVAATHAADTSGATASSSGGGSTSGASRATSSTSESHSHTGAVALTGGSTSSVSPGVSDQETGTTPHVHQHSNTHSHGPNSLTGSVAFGGSHNHDIPHTHSTPNHTHPNHDHTIPAHNHVLTLGISEGGTAAGIRLFIDGTDRSAALGGPWSAATLVDITRYLVDVRAKPVAGAHPIEFTVTSIGAIEVWFDWTVIAKVTN